VAELGSAQQPAPPQKPQNTRPAASDSGCGCCLALKCSPLVHFVVRRPLAPPHLVLAAGLPHNALVPGAAGVVVSVARKGEVWCGVVTCSAVPCAACIRQLQGHSGGVRCSLSSSNQTLEVAGLHAMPITSPTPTTGQTPHCHTAQQCARLLAASGRTCAPSWRP